MTVRHHLHRPVTVALRALSGGALVAATVSGLAHIVGIGYLGALAAAVSIVMAVSCVGCAAHLVRRPSATGSWLVMAVMAAAMIAIHMVAMSGHGGHTHGAGVVTVSSVGVPTTMELMVLASGVELIIALVGLWVATADRVVMPESR